MVSTNTVSKETIGSDARYGNIVSVKTKAATVGEITELLSALVDRHDGADGVDEERDYLVAACPGRLEPTIRDLTTLAMHLLAGIGEGATNIVGLAARSGQLKGTVSKQVQRLVEAGLVERGPVENNRKEIRLTLTDDGTELVRAHRRMHDEKSDALSSFLMRYTNAELEVLVTVLGDLVGSGTSVLPPLSGRGR
jgi:DNA-binding MarR family transcriptional regulator